MRGYRQACAAGVLAIPLPSSSAAQTAGVPPPRPDFIFHDENVVGPFTVERWVSAANPEVSPAGTCECLTTVYAGGRFVLTLGEVGLASAIALDGPSGRDITGDGLADLIVTDWSGGAHCCYSTSAYSLESDGALRRVLQLATGSCQTRFEDLDGDQRLEAVTCEDGWAGENCSFADRSAFEASVMARMRSSPLWVPR